MGRELRPEHLGFFHARMTEHDRVESVDALPNNDEYMFRVHRTRGRSPVTVHFTDAYRYGMMDYISRPKEVGRGSFVVLGMPHASYDEEIIDDARRDGIGIGHIGKFMGALTRDNVSEYETPQERADRIRRAKEGH